MADFAATRRAHATSFTNRIGREVVVQQEVGFEVAVQCVDELFVVARAERCHNEALSFATCKQCRAVCAWQETCLANNRTYRIKRATIDPLACFHNVATQDASFKLLESRTEVRICKLLFCQRAHDGCSCRRNSSRTLLLIGQSKCSTHRCFACRFHSFI